MCDDGNGTQCGVDPLEIGVVPQDVALYINPEEANLTVGRKYVEQTTGAHLIDVCAECKHADRCLAMCSWGQTHTHTHNTHTYTYTRTHTHTHTHAHTNTLANAYVASVPFSHTIRYAVVFRAQTHRTPNGTWYGVETREDGTGLMQRNSNGQWVAIDGGISMQFWSPNPPSTMRPNQLHADWIAFQVAVNAHFVAEYSGLVRSLASPAQVLIYSGYTGSPYRVWSGDDYAHVESAYGVDWSLFSASGMDVAVCGYGYNTRGINDTLAALATGSHNRPQPARLACGCGAADLCGADGAPLTPKSYEENERLLKLMLDSCDGVMVYYGGGIAGDPGYTVPE